MNYNQTPASLYASTHKGIIAPTLDRYADLGEVKSTVKPVANVYSLYGKTNLLHFTTPLEINRMTGAMEEEITDFYASIINKKSK